MFVLTVAIVASLAGNALAQATFNLDCSRYPDVCDNHCNAFSCYGLYNVGIHRDITAADTGDDNRRRAAVGCGSNNYCPAGTACDEYPYASTYDGGLGCYPDGYDGGATLIQSGNTRCVDPGQNSAHGADLGNFYTQNNINNGDAFIVAVPNQPSGVSPLCDDLRANGSQACPGRPGVPEGPYRQRSTPATPSCPARGSRRRSILSFRAGLEESKRLGEIKVRTIYTDANQTLSVYGHGDGPKIGGKVWTGSETGGFTSTIVKVVEEQ
ncbi:hypothetical protein V5O48_005484 [Marasmius crinis-equi]|uniref:Deoxyribonuclease NucA/NucB domain-containing protein n=1 Tax=Marasmius crinis-equi TaxID=585013 RepID=A0ABR3FN34_9AGAR